MLAGVAVAGLAAFGGGADEEVCIRALHAARAARVEMLSRAFEVGRLERLGFAVELKATNS